MANETVPSLFLGRKAIFTDAPEITAENVVPIVAQSYINHVVNREQMIALFEYERGNQPIFYRVKDIRPEINIPACANYARLITDFKVSYEFSAPIMFVQRARDDYRKSDPKQDDKRISTLNEMLFEQGKPTKDYQMAGDFKRCGLGYMAALPKKEISENEVAPFDLLVLNPLNTYVIRTNDAYRKVIAAVTYITEMDTQVNKFTVYTDKRVFQFDSLAKQPVETVNPIGLIPIIEFPNNLSRQACFEAVIPLMDALNIVNSDRVNDVAQYVQSILWLNNCKVSDEQTDELRNGGFIQTKDTADGRQASVTYVTAPLNQQETQSLVGYMYSQILEIAGVPGREASTGGNTGSAILLSNGWQLAETQAKAMEVLINECEQQLLRVILAIIRNTPSMPEELKKLQVSDVLIKFPRNRGYDLVSRTSALSNMINIGIDPEKAISVVDIFDDAQQAAIDSLERIDDLLFKKQTSNTQEASREPDLYGDGNTVGGARASGEYQAENLQRREVREDAQIQAKHNSGVS